LIDGRKFRGFPCRFICLEQGETKSLSIAAASIIAKVYRDTLMQNLHEEIFRYDFGSNKGYGSKNHFEALEKYGPSQYHRKSFLHKFNQIKEQQGLKI
jgi:ribonuclease HII